MSWPGHPRPDFLLDSNVARPRSTAHGDPRTSGARSCRPELRDRATPGRRRSARVGGGHAVDAPASALPTQMQRRLLAPGLPDDRSRAVAGHPDRPPHGDLGVRGDVALADLLAAAVAGGLGDRAGERPGEDLLADGPGVPAAARRAQLVDRAEDGALVVLHRGAGRVPGLVGAAAGCERDGADKAGDAGEDFSRHAMSGTRWSGRRHPRSSQASTRPRSALASATLASDATATGVSNALGWGYVPTVRKSQRALPTFVPGGR